MGPIRTGFVYGIAGVLVALCADLYFLFIDPAETPGWILAVIAQYRTRLALAIFLFLAVLAALRVRPTHLDPGVPYRSLLLRDGALAATVVAVMVGITLFLTTALQATVLAGTARDYASEAAPKIVSYVNEVRTEIRQTRKERGASPERVRDLPPPAKVSEVEATLQPPTLRDLGRSIANFVLRAVLLGTVGGLVGVLRGRPASVDNEKPSAAPRRE
ncbi:MAG TPA: hypothetical protein VJ827_05460 [Rubrobacter sp.]|nr:hypothetical protein [Rubrobacter sp.]